MIETHLYVWECEMCVTQKFETIVDIECTHLNSVHTVHTQQLVWRAGVISPLTPHSLKHLSVNLSNPEDLD